MSLAIFNKIQDYIRAKIKPDPDPQLVWATHLAEILEDLNTEVEGFGGNYAKAPIIVPTHADMLLLYLTQPEEMVERKTQIYVVSEKKYYWFVDVIEQDNDGGFLPLNGIDDTKSSPETTYSSEYIDSHFGTGGGTSHPIAKEITTADPTWNITTHKFGYHDAATADIDVAVTLADNEAGIMRFTQDATGGYTLALNGSDIDVNPDPETDTTIEVYKVNGRITAHSRYAAVIAPPTTTTPAAPTFTNFNDTADTVELVPVSGIPMADYRYTIPGSATVLTAPTDGILSAGNVAGVITAWSVADGLRNQSPNATSPAFTIAYSGGTPPEAADYFTSVEATGVTLTTTQKDAYTAWVTREQTAGRYSKYNGIFPIMGATQAAHAINAKTPGTGNLTFSGTWLHTADGMKITDAVMGNSDAVTTLATAQDDNAIMVYVNEDTGSDGYLFGAAATGAYTDFGTFSGTLYTRDSAPSAVSIAAVGSLNGVQMITRTNATEFHWLNKGVDTTITQASVTGTIAMALGNIYALGSNSSQRRFGFFIVSSGLTVTEAQGLTTSINTLMSDLNRDY